MASQCAPKQWQLTKSETITSFENWRQIITYTISLDTGFATYLNATWRKRTAANPIRGFKNDPDTVEASDQKTAVYIKLLS
jgi:hypothetical protein